MNSKSDYQIVQLMEMDAIPLNSPNEAGRGSNLNLSSSQEILHSKVSLLQTKRFWISTLAIAVIWFVIIFAITTHKSPVLFGYSGVDLSSINGSRVSIDDLFSWKFTPNTISFDWVNTAKPGDHPGEYLKFDYSSGILLNSAVDQSSQVLISKEHLKRPDGSFINNLIILTMSFDRSHLLVAEFVASRWRNSALKNYYVITLLDKSIVKLAPSPILYAAFAPSSLDIVYTMNQDLYIKKALDNYHPIAENASEVVFNGIADWVYEEEVLGSDKANWWSPDSQLIAYLTFDDSKVEIYDYPVYHVGQRKMGKKILYPEIKHITYPKPSTPNPDVYISIYNVGVSTSIRLGIPSSISEPIVYQCVWNTDSTKLLVKVMNRSQNQQIYVLYNLDGSSKILRDEKTSAWFNHISDVIFISPDEYLDLVVKENFNHIAKFSTNPEVPVKFLTEGVFEVTKILGYNAEAQVVYYQATQTSDDDGISIQRQIYAVSLTEPSKLERLSPEGEGFNTASISPDQKWLVVNFEGPDIPRQILIDLSAKSQKVINNNQELRDIVSEYAFPTSEILEIPIPNTDGWKANVKVIYPLGFDSTKSQFYPFMVEVYGGPGSQKVSSKWGVSIASFFTSNVHYGTPAPSDLASSANSPQLSRLFSSYNAATAQPPFVYALIDVRGTGFQGQDYMHSVARHLGDYEATDVIEVVRNFVSDRDYIDKDKVGVWGWSYGGYLTSRILQTQQKKYPTEKVFSVGVAVAPVIDWLFYDTIYTERYMGRYEENRNNYSMSSVEPEFGGTRYLLMHGLADDNVHYQHTADMVDQIQKKIEYPDSVRVHVVPDNDHGMSKTFMAREYVYKSLVDYVVDTFREIDSTRHAMLRYWKSHGSFASSDELSLLEERENWCKVANTFC